MTESMYNIVRIRPDGDYIRLFVQDEETETSFTIMAEDFYHSHYSADEQISQQQYDQLKQQHAYCFGYRKCLRKLAVRDQSVAEIKGILDEVEHITQQQKDDILNELTEAGFVDDERLVASQLDYDRSRLIGHRKSFYSLLKRGIDRDIINAQIDLLDPEQEIDNGVILAGNIYSSLSNMSHYQAISKVKEKLMANGYESQQIYQIMSRCNFTKDTQKQQEAADAAARTGYLRYSKRYQGKILRQKLYQFLANKGYNSEEINSAIQSLEVNEDEDY